MFSKKSLHVTLAFVLLIGLAAMGLVYGQWSETLTIDGTVATGNLNVKFGTVEIEDNETIDIGQCGATYDEGRNVMTFALTNAYPGYECRVDVNVTNDGSIPVVLPAYPTGVNFEPGYDWPTPPFNVDPQPAGTSFTIGAGQSEYLGYIVFSVPATEEGHMTESFEGTMYLNFSQQQQSQP